MRHTFVVAALVALPLVAFAQDDSVEIDLREGGSVKGRLVEFGKRVYRVEVDGKVVEIEERSVREVRFPGHAKAAAPVVRRASEAAAKAFGHGNRAVRLALSADGKRLLTAGESENGDLKTTSVVLWDASSLAATGHCEKIRTFDERASRNAEGKETEVERVLLMPDGKRAVTGTHDARIQIWDLETGKLLRTFVHDEKWSLSSIALSRDGRFLASAAADGRITLWDVDGAREITTTTTIDANSLALDFSPEGKRLLAVRKQGVVSVLDVAAAVEGKGLVEVATLDGHQRMIWAGGFLPDGRHAFSCDDEGVLYHWDVENREVASTCLGTGRLLPTVAISPDGTRALVSGAVSDMIKLYDIEAGRELRAFHVPGGAGSIAFLPDGRHAILGGWRKGTLQLLDLGSDEPAEQRARRLPFNPFADARAGDWIVYEGSEALTARISPVTIGRIDSESVTLSFPAAANGSRPRTVPPFADESDGSTVIVVDETTKVGDREVPCKKVMVVVPGRIKHTMWLSPLVPTGIVRGESRNLAGTDDLVFHVAGYGNGEKATWGK
ncbi:MAG TPA: hypothetical protein VFF73_21875, partial [Planctomycetota bacterium]|nr:hypothetical protein [Planctomycetota bacterium]